MTLLTVSYGLISPQSPNKKHSHILPISRILHPKLTDDYYLTAARDGSIVLHPYSNTTGTLRFQVHSDWVSDIIEINQHSYITTSHDFSIVHFSLLKAPNNTWTANMKIIGNHTDYIKCINYIPKSDIFVTGGLDSQIKVWKISYENRNNTPHFNLYHTFTNDSGSIYNMTTLRDNSGEFDLIVGDCNGDIIFYSCTNRKEIKRIRQAHETNIKIIRLIDNETKLLSSCSNGVIHIWAISDVENLNRIKSWKWNCSIWSMDGHSLDSLLVGDSMGNINLFNFEDFNNIKVNLIFSSTEYFAKYIKDLDNDNSGKDKHFGILDLKLLNGSNVYFSYCSDSNLNCLNLKTNQLYIEKGGFALTRSSLLTNRRHVITENTQGKVQRWDIVSCELINTFERSEGTFDDIVMKYTSKEILSHWCTVSVKVGMLFVKIGPRFSNTELYGSALSNYDIINDVKINSDDRYNIGKIVVNSLFNDFLNFEVHNDEVFRKNLVSKKKDHDNVESEVSNNTSKSSNNNSKTNESLVFNENSTPKTKDKFKKISAFTRLGSSMSIGAQKSETPYVSAPSTPIEKDLPSLNYNNSTDPMGTGTNRNNNISHGPPKTAPSAIPDDESHAKLQSDLVHPIPLTSKNLTGRAQSSGSILTRKLKSFRPSKTEDTSLDEDNKVHETPVENETPEDQQVWNKIHTVSDKIEDSQFDDARVHDSNTASSSSVYLKSSNSEINESRVQSNTTFNQPTPPNTSNTQENRKGKKEFMCDLTSEYHISYTEQYFGNLNSLKLLTRRMPETLLRRDLSSPVVRIRLATLLLVHSWEAGTSGGSVLSSNILPPTPKSVTVPLSTSSSNNSNSLDLNDQTDAEQKKSTNLMDDNDIFEAQHVMNNSEIKDIDNYVSTTKKELFERLENDLPYWFAEKLCQEVRVTLDEQPKLNFILEPWINSEQADNTTNSDDYTHSKSELGSSQKHHMLKFGRSKGNEPLGATDLPKIPDTNARLTAPGMIKVKKIKYYVLDRFEYKTPEMKAKIDPNSWLELLCKGQLLDNDMTLSTVRTLYWKSQGEIVLNYRRKPTGSSPLAREI